MAKVVNGLGSEWFNRILRWGTLLALMGFRRWRHLVVYLGIILVVAWLTHALSLVVTRSRPLGIEILERWDGFAFPSRPVAALGVTLTGIVYTMVRFASSTLSSRSRMVRSGLWNVRVMPGPWPSTLAALPPGIQRIPGWGVGAPWHATPNKAAKATFRRRGTVGT